MNKNNNPLLNRYFSDCFALQLWVRSLQEPHGNWMYDAACEKLLGGANPRHRDLLPITALFSTEKIEIQPTNPSLIQWLPKQLKTFGRSFELFSEASSKSSEAHTLEKLLRVSWLKEALDSGITPLKALRQFPLGNAQKEHLQACLDRVQAGLQEVESVPTLHLLIGNELKDLEKQLIQALKKPILEPVRESINTLVYIMERLMTKLESRLKALSTADDMEILMSWLPFLHHLLSSCPTFIGLNATIQCLRFAGFHVVLQRMQESPGGIEPALRDLLNRNLESLAHHLNANMGFDLPFQPLIKQGIGLFATLNRKIESHGNLDSVTKEGWKQSVQHYQTLLEPLQKASLSQFKTSLRESILQLYQLAESGQEQAGAVFYHLSRQLQTLSVKGEMIDYHLLQISLHFQQDTFDPEQFTPMALKRLRWILSQLKDDIAQDHLETACLNITQILNSLDAHQLSRLKPFFIQILPLIFSPEICQKLIDVASRNLSAGQVVVFISLVGKAVSPISEEITAFIDEDLSKRTKTPDHHLNTPHFRNALANHARKCLLQLSPTVMKRLRNALSLPTRGYPLILNALGLPEIPNDADFEDILSKATLTMTAFSDSQEKEIALRYWHHRLTLALFKTLFRESSDDMRTRLSRHLNSLATFTVSSLLIPELGGEILLRQLACLLKNDMELSRSYAEKMASQLEHFSAPQRDHLRDYLSWMMPKLCKAELPFIQMLTAVLRHQAPAQKESALVTMRDLIDHLSDSILGAQDLHPCRTLLRFTHTLFLSMEWVRRGDDMVMSPALHVRLDRYLKDHFDAFHNEVPKEISTLLDHHIHLEKSHIPAHSYQEADALLSQDYRSLNLTPEQHLFARLVILLIRSKTESTAMAKLMVLWLHHLEVLPDVLGLLEPIMKAGSLHTLFFEAMAQTLTADEQWRLLHRLIPSTQEMSRMPELSPFMTAWLKHAHALLDGASATGKIQVPDTYHAMRACVSLLITRIIPLLQKNNAPLEETLWAEHYRQLLNLLLNTGSLQLSDLTGLDSLPEIDKDIMKQWTEIWTETLHFLRGQIVIDPSTLTLKQVETLYLFLTSYSHFIPNLRYQDGGLYLRCVTWLTAIYHYHPPHPSTHELQKQLENQLKKLKNTLLPKPLTLDSNSAFKTLSALYNTQYHPDSAEQLEVAFFEESSLEEQAAFLTIMTATPLLLHSLLMRTQGSVSTQRKKNSLTQLLQTQFATLPSNTEMAYLLYEALLELTSKRFHDFMLFKDHAFSLMKNARLGRHYHLVLQQLSRIFLGYQDLFLEKKMISRAMINALSEASPTKLHLSLIEATRQISKGLSESHPSESIQLEEALGSLLLAFLFMHLHYGVDFETPSDELLAHLLPLMQDCRFSRFEALSEPAYHALHAEECRSLHRLLELSTQMASSEKRWELLKPVFQQLSIFTLTKRQETITVFYLLHRYGISFEEQLSLLPTLDAQREFLDILYSHHADLGLYVCSKTLISYETLPFIRRKVFQNQGNTQENDLFYILWFLQGTPDYSAFFQSLIDSLHVTPQALHIDAFAVAPSAYLQETDLLKAGKALLAAKAKCSLAKLLTQYQAHASVQVTQALLQFFEGLLTRSDDELELFLPFVLLRHPEAFFLLLQEQHQLLQSRIIDHFLSKENVSKGKTSFLLTLHLLLQNDGFKSEFMTEIRIRYEKDTLGIEALPTQLLVEALLQEKVPLQAIESADLLSDVVRLLYSQEQDALIEDAIQEVFPKLTDAMESVFYRNNKLLLGHTLRLMNAAAIHCPDLLEAFLVRIINTHNKTLDVVLEQLFSHPLFMASHPDREKRLKALVSTLFSKTKNSTELTETVLLLIQKSHQAHADFQIPQDLLQILQQHLIGGQASLSLRELLGSLEVLSSLPHPFDPAHLSTLKEGFLDVDKVELLTLFSAKSPLLFRELLLLPEITQTLYTFLQIGYNPAMNELKEILIREIRQFSKYEASQFLKQYLSEALFGHDVHTQVGSVLDQLMPQLDPAAYPESAQKALNLPLDKVGNVQSSFVVSRLLSYINSPYVLLDAADPFFNATVEALCLLVHDTRPLELVQLCLYELDQPADQLNYTSLTTAFGAICQDQQQAKSLLKQLLHRKANWQSPITHQLLRHWRSGSSLLDQLSGALSPASQPLMTEWIDQLSQSLVETLSHPTLLTSEDLEWVLDRICFVIKSTPSKWTSPLVSAFSGYISTHFDDNPTLIIAKLLSDPYIAQAQLQQLVLPFISIKGGVWAHIVVSMTLTHPIFPKIWETLMACFSDEQLSRFFLHHGSDLDEVLLERGPGLLTTHPSHVLTLFSSGVSVHLDYYTVLFLKWIQSEKIASADKPQLLTALLQQATKQPSPFFFTVFSRGVLQQHRVISASLTWFYNALISMSHISFDDLFAPFPGLSGHTKTLISAYLETHGFIDSEHHLHAKWSPGLRILLETITSLSSEEALKQKLTSQIKRYFTQVYTARQTLLQTLFTEDSDLFIQPKTGLLIHAVSQNTPTWNRLIDDALTILSTNRTLGPDLLKAFLRQLTLPQSERLIFRTEQPEMVKRFMIQQLLTKDMVIETLVDGQSKSKHLLKTLIRHVLSEISEDTVTSDQSQLLGMHETFLLMFAQAPTIFSALVGSQKDTLNSRLFLNLEALLEIRSRLIHWLNDNTEPTLVLFSEKAFSLVRQGFRLLDVLTVVHSMTPLMPGGVESFQSDVHRFMVLNHRNSLPQEWGHLTSFLQLLQPGLPVGKLTEETLSEFHNADKLFRELYLTGWVDDYGQTLQQDDTPNYQHLFDTTIPRATAYSLELEQSYSFYSKELAAFSTKLAALIKGQQQPLMMSMIEIVTTLKWCDATRRNPHTPALLTTLKHFLDALMVGNLQPAVSEKMVLVVHGLFASETGTLDENRAQLFLEHSHPGPEKAELRTQLLTQMLLLNALFGMVYIKDKRFTNAIFTLAQHSKSTWFFLRKGLDITIENTTVESLILERCQHLLPTKTAALNPELFQLMAKELEPHLKRWEAQVAQAFSAAASSESGIEGLQGLLMGLENMLDQEGLYLK